MTHNILGLTIAFAILWMVFAIHAHAQSYYNNSQGEGSYNGSVGGTGDYRGMQNSQGAASYYHGGGNGQYPSYGVPDHPAGNPCGYSNCD